MRRCGLDSSDSGQEPLVGGGMNLRVP